MGTAAPGGSHAAGGAEAWLCFCWAMGESSQGSNEKAEGSQSGPHDPWLVSCGHLSHPGSLWPYQSQSRFPVAL